MSNMITLVKTFYPELKILVLSAHDEMRTVINALRAGASGFICKTCSPQALLEAIKEVAATGRYIPRGMAERLEYAAVSTPADNANAEVENKDGVVRLNGKTIDEWR